ncbi:MAG: radical SAM protein [Coriobacteriia bacterium]|nr:radical SAM protein [Coriobacteriia bacterium]
MLPFARVEVGMPSRRRCRLCDPAAPSFVWRSPADLAAELREIVAEWTAPVGPSVMLAGAEPFLHPELPTIVASARNEGFERIGIETDGVALDVEQNVRGSLGAGVRHVRVTLFGVGPVGDRLAGRSGACDASLAGIRRFVRAADAAGMPVAVAAVVPVCRHNADQAHLVVAAAAQAGAGHVRLEAAGDPIAGIEAVLAAACDTGTVNRVWVEVAGLEVPESHAVHRVREGGGA